LITSLIPLKLAELLWVEELTPISVLNPLTPSLRATLDAQAFQELFLKIKEVVVALVLIGKEEFSPMNT